MQTPVIIAVSGHSRSGKDTLIDMMGSELAAHGVPYVSFSSIDPVKRFVDDIKRNHIDKGGLNKDLDSFERQALADIKKTLDDNFAFTTRYAQKLLMIDQPKALFYQLREVDNIERLKAYCDMNQFGFLSVYQTRHSTKSGPRASTDHARPDDFDHDFIIVSPEGDFIALNEYADMIARRAVRMYLKELPEIPL